MQRFYVAPDGDDGASGSREAPFATLAKTVEMACSGMLQENTEFVLRAGEYVLTEGLEITCSPGVAVTWRAQAGETAVLTGARRLPKGAWEPMGDGKWRIAVPGLHNARHLYVNGIRAQRTRTAAIPTAGWEMAEDADMVFYHQSELFHSYLGDIPVYDGYRTNRREMLTWRNPRDIEFVYDVGWSHAICPVERIMDSPDGVIVTMRQPCFRECQIKAGVRIGAPSYMENIFELLKAPGQWYLDRKSEYLYYIPRLGEDMADVEAWVPVAERLLTVSGTPDAPVRHLRFEGIQFCDTTWLGPSEQGHPELQANLAKGVGDDHEFHSNYVLPPGGIRLTHCEDVWFEACTVSRMGCGAFDILQGARRCRISRCEMRDISGSAVQLGGFLREDAHPADLRSVTRDTVIENCTIHDVGVEYKGGVGILAGYADHTRIVHNEIYNVAYSGISVGWGWGYWDQNADAMCYCGPLPHYPRFQTTTVSRRFTVAYNHVHHVMQQLHDGGGIYTLSMNEQSEIVGNLVHDNGKPGAVLTPYPGLLRKVPLKGEDEARPYLNQQGFPGGIYLDQASGGFRVTGNILYNVVCPIFYHDYGMNGVFDTNTFADNTFNIGPGHPAFPVERARMAGVEEESP